MLGQDELAGHLVVVRVAAEGAVMGVTDSVTHTRGAGARARRLVTATHATHVRDAATLLVAKLGLEVADQSAHRRTVATMDLTSAVVAVHQGVVSPLNSVQLALGVLPAARVHHGGMMPAVAGGSQLGDDRTQVADVVARQLQLLCVLLPHFAKESCVLAEPGSARLRKVAVALVGLDSRQSAILVVLDVVELARQAPDAVLETINLSELGVDLRSRVGSVATVLGREAGVLLGKDGELRVGGPGRGLALLREALDVSGEALVGLLQRLDGGGVVLVGLGELLLQSGVLVGQLLEGSLGLGGGLLGGSDGVLELLLGLVKLGSEILDLSLELRDSGLVLGDGIRGLLLVLCERGLDLLVLGQQLGVLAAVLGHEARVKSALNRTAVLGRLQKPLLACDLSLLASDELVQALDVVVEVPCVLALRLELLPLEIKPLRQGSDVTTIPIDKFVVPALKLLVRSEKLAVLQESKAVKLGVVLKGHFVFLHEADEVVLELQVGAILAHILADHDAVLLAEVAREQLNVTLVSTIVHLCEPTATTAPLLGDDAAAAADASAARGLKRVAKTGGTLSAEACETHGVRSAADQLGDLLDLLLDLLDLLLLLGHLLVLGLLCLLAGPELAVRTASVTTVAVQIPTKATEPTVGLTAMLAHAALQTTHRTEELLDWEAAGPRSAHFLGLLGLLNLLGDLLSDLLGNLLGDLLGLQAMDLVVSLHPVLAGSLHVDIPKQGFAIGINLDVVIVGLRALGLVQIRDGIIGILVLQGIILNHILRLRG
mmetsp:Transcript_36558/g.84752  ORF Transcript_36558/g.84752 Transcript_36558/m.84752 type:complete len:774 (+) Transcript_36558:1366-3687(+)